MHRSALCKCTSSHSEGPRRLISRCAVSGHHRLPLRVAIPRSFSPQATEVGPVQPDTNNSVTVRRSCSANASAALRFRDASSAPKRPQTVPLDRAVAIPLAVLSLCLFRGTLLIAELSTGLGPKSGIIIQAAPSRCHANMTSSSAWIMPKQQRLINNGSCLVMFSTARNAAHGIGCRCLTIAASTAG